MIGNYTALDLETTGLNPKYDKIIEVGAVKVRNGEIIDRFQQLVCPGIALPEKITGLTGITQEELLEAKGSETVIPQLLDFLEDDVILGHSVMFDYLSAGASKQKTCRSVPALWDQASGTPGIGRCRKHGTALFGIA